MLPVSELENVILLPTVSRAILEGEGYVGESLAARLEEIANHVFALNDDEIERAVVRYCSRRIDRALKRIDLADAATVADLVSTLSSKVSAVDVTKIADVHRALLKQAVATRNLAGLLAHYDNKGVLAVAASRLKTTKKDAFEGWLCRVLATDNAPKLVEAIRAVLPTLAR